jgi:hypothetical protein
MFKEMPVIPVSKVVDPKRNNTFCVNFLEHIFRNISGHTAGQQCAQENLQCQNMEDFRKLCTGLEPRFFGLSSRVARWYIFKPKIPIWVNFGGSCNWGCWYISWPFGIFCGHPAKKNICGLHMLHICNFLQIFFGRKIFLKNILSQMLLRTQGYFELDQMRPTNTCTISEGLIFHKVATYFTHVCDKIFKICAKFVKNRVW